MCIEYGPCEDTWSWSSGIRNLTKRPSALELSHLVHSLFLVFRYISFTTWVRNLELFWSVAGWRLWRSARPCREDRRVSFCNSACSISRRHRTVIVLWMDTIVHSLIWRISHSLQCFKHSNRCRIFPSTLLPFHKQPLRNLSLVLHFRSQIRLKP